MNAQHPYIYPYFINEKGEQIRPSPAVYQQIAELLGEPAPKKLLPPVKVVVQGQAIQFTLAENSQKQRVNASPKAWQLTLESAEILTGKCKNNQLSLPQDLPLGYHQLTVEDVQCRGGR